MKLHELAKKIGKSNTDTRLLLQDLGLNGDSDSVPDDVAQAILNKVQDIKKELPPEPKQPDAKQANTPGGLEQTIALSGHQSSQAIESIFQGVENDAESLANLVSAKFVAKFSATVAENQTNFSKLYLQGLAFRINEIQNQVQNQIQASENFIQSLPQPKLTGVIPSLLPSVK